MRVCALVGSRQIAKPEHSLVARKYYSTCYRLAELGILSRSGGALGCDYIAEKAYYNYWLKQRQNDLLVLPNMEIFVPWSGFSAIRGQKNPLSDFHILADDNTFKTRCEIVKSVMSPGHYFALSFAALKLHARNANQILGETLNDPVLFTFCWTENGENIGGTRTAIMLSLKNNIPVFNLGEGDHVLHDLGDFLKSKKII